MSPKNSVVLHMDSVEAPSRRVSEAQVEAQAKEESESESGVKLNTDISDMGRPSVFWVRSRSITCIISRYKTSGVERRNWVLVASTSASGWKRLMTRSQASRPQQMMGRSVL